MLTLFLIAAFFTLVLVGIAGFTLITGAILFFFPRVRSFAPFVLLVPTLTALGAAGGSWGLGAFADKFIEPLFAGAPLFGFLLGFPVGAFLGFPSALDLPVGFAIVSLLHMPTRPNHALQRTAAGHRGCNRRASWPPSLSLG